MNKKLCLFLIVLVGVVLSGHLLEGVFAFMFAVLFVSYWALVYIFVNTLYYIGIDLTAYL